MHDALDRAREALRVWRETAIEDVQDIPPTTAYDGEPPFRGKDWILDPENEVAVGELTGFAPAEIRAIKVAIKPSYDLMHPRRPGRTLRIGIWEGMLFGLCQLTGNSDQRQVAAMFRPTPKAQVQRGGRRFFEAAAAYFKAEISERPRDPIFTYTGGFGEHFPTAVGVVDGTYVRCPKEKSPSGGPDVTYSGKHRVHCRTALIVVNSAGRLLDATGAWPGSYHDTRVFKEEEVHMKFSHNVNGVITFDVLMGDLGFEGIPRIMPGFIIPFKGKQKSAAQKEFNKRLHTQRQTVERVFGRMKCRMRMMHDKCRAHPAEFEAIWWTALFLTDFHIDRHPLNAQDPVPKGVPEDIELE